MSEMTVQFDLAMLAVKEGAPPRGVMNLLQDTWNVPKLLILKAKGDDEERDTSAGAHGIPEIGRQEQAFYNALTAGQRDAYTALRQLVDALYDENKGWTGVDPWSIDTPIDQWKNEAIHNIATHPMQAYLLGQMLATDAINTGLARPLLPTDRRAIEFMDHHAFNEIDDAYNHLKSKLRTALILGMQNGDNPRTVAARFSTTIKDYETQWDVIAITETARAESQGRLNELADQNVEYCIGSSAHDPRVCDDCKRLIDGQTYRVSDVVGVSNYGVKRAGWEACIPLHPRCRCVWLPVFERDKF